MLSALPEVQNRLATALHEKRVAEDAHAHMRKRVNELEKLLKASGIAAPPKKHRAPRANMEAVMSAMRQHKEEVDELLKGNLDDWVRRLFRQE